MRASGFIKLLLGIILSLVLAVTLAAQAKKASKPKTGRVDGRVQMINKDTSTVTVEKSNIRRQVVYGSDTKFLYGHSKKNKPGAADQLKEGNYIACSGTFNEKAQLQAQTCVYREQK